MITSSSKVQKAREHCSVIAWGFALCSSVEGMIQSCVHPTAMGTSLPPCEPRAVSLEVGVLAWSILLEHKRTGTECRGLCSPCASMTWGHPIRPLSSTSSLYIHLLSTQIQPQLWVWGPHLHQYPDSVYKGNLYTVLSS